MSVLGKPRRLWLPKEDVVLRQHYGNKRYAQISALLSGRSWFDVRNRAMQLGMTGHSNLGRRYSAKQGFFSRPSIVNSYWAGFIAADGCVSDHRRLSIGLAVRDAGHLRELARALEYTGPVIIRQDRAALGISCRRMIKDLKNNFNITERKSLTLRPPPLRHGKLALAFITGVIDGDGCISAVTGRGYLRIAVYGTKWLLAWTKEAFDRIAPQTMRGRERSIVRAMRGRRLYSYTVSSRRAEAVARILVKLRVPRLARKWRKVDRLLSLPPVSIGNRQNMARVLR